MEVELTIGKYQKKEWVFVMELDGQGAAVALADGVGLHGDSATTVGLECVSGIPGTQRKVVRLGKTTGAVWMVPIANGQSAVRLLESNGVKVRPVPRSVLEVVCDNTKYGVDMPKLEALGIWGLLRPFQRESVKFMISKGRAINASEMGTGKTATGVCLSEYYRELKPQLVVCPSSLRANWKNEFKKFADCDVHVVKNGNGNFKERSIISYSLLSSKKIARKLPKFKLIIMDESHYIKNQSSKRSKLLISLCKRATKVFLLTGTPSSKSQDLFTQLRAMDPDRFVHFFPHDGRPKKGVFYFATRYCDPTKVYLGRGRHGFKFDGCQREWELHAVLSKYMTRKTKESALPNLPPKTRERVLVGTLTGSAKTQFQGYLRAVVDIREEHGNRRAEARLMELVRKTSELKRRAIIKYVTCLIENRSDSKYLIFAHHRSIISALCSLMEEKGQNFVLIDGRTRTDVRQSLVDKFQGDHGVNFALLSIRAAGVGLNMYSANVVVFCELLWSDKDHIQSEDRAHRQNQENEVVIKYLVMGGTTDDVVWRTISRKVGVSGVLLDNGCTEMRARFVCFDDPVFHTGEV